MDDARLVQIALNQGLVTQEQIELARRELRAQADRGLDNSLWYLLQDLGYLSEDAARKVRKSASSVNHGALEVDGYVIQGRLGNGGMGDVFRARNAKGEEVAVKLLNSKYSSNDEYQRRFEREARASMRLRHAHICHSLSAGVAHGTHYLVMEIVEGLSLKAHIQDKGPISEREALFLLEQMASALGSAWDQGVLHRDVKPANIILGPARAGHDEPFCAKLIDFGLAKVWQGSGRDQEDSAGGLTGAGLALGTPHYMSPEQASGQADLDQRCDIYGLGASLYHALMGHTMYSGKSSAVIMYKQVTEQIDLSELRKKGARKQLVELLERMLAKDRDRRIETWKDVLAACVRIKALLHAGLGIAPGAQARSANPRVSAVITEALDLQQEHRAASRSGRRPVARGMILSLVAVTVVTATAAWVWVGSGGPVVAAPATLTGLLRPGATEIYLTPGSYPALRLGAAQAGLTLRANGPGVSVAGIAADPGLQLALSGIDLTAPLQISAGAQVTISGGTLTGAEVTGGSLTLKQVQVRDDLNVSRQGHLIAANCQFSHRVNGEDAHLELQDSTITQGLVATRCDLQLTGCTVTSAGTALSLDRSQQVSLIRTHLTGGPVGLAAAGSQLQVCDAVDITAQGVGIAWSGPAATEWRWQGLRLTAPTPSTGLPPALLAAADGHSP
jgi:serine/threonine-protein kinase